MTRTKQMVVLTVAAAVLLVSTVQAQVLQQVPANALVVLKVNNLKATNDKVIKLAQDLGVAAMVPPLANPLAALQQQLGIQQGLNLDGELAFVFVDPDSVGGNPEQAMLILIPVADHAAFLANFPGAQTEGDISQVTMAGSPRPGFIASRGKYAALAPSRETLAQKPTEMLKVPPLISKELASKDVVIFANLAALENKALPEMERARAEILREMNQNAQRDPAMAKYSAVLTVLINKMMDVAEAAVKDADAATMGISLGADGISVTTMVECAPGTYAGNVFSKLTSSDAPLVAGLPEGKYLLYGGGVNDGPTISKLIADFTTPILKELVAVGPEMQPAQDYVDALQAMVAAQTGSSFGLLTPSGQLGAEAIFQFVAVATGDAKAMATAYTKASQAQSDFMKGLKVPGLEGMTPSVNLQAKTVDGVNFDSVVTKPDMNAQTPQAMQQAQMMTMMYGPEGAVVYYGVAGDKLLMASGVKDEMITKLITSSKQNLAPLAQNTGVAAVAPHLPKRRLMVMYVAVSDIVTTALTYAQQFGMAVPLMLPPDLPPLGVTVGTEGTALRFDVYVPTTLVQSLVAAGMQAAMQMQGGGPAGGGL